MPRYQNYGNVITEFTEKQAIDHAAAALDIATVSAFHEVEITPAEGFGQVGIFGFRIQAKDRFALHPEVGQKQFQEIRLPLSGVAENQDIAVAPLSRAAVGVGEDVCAEAVAPDVEAVRVGSPTVGERVQVRHGACGEDALIFAPEVILATRQAGLKALLLTEEQPVCRDAVAGQFGHDLCLQQFQVISIPYD